MKGDPAWFRHGCEFGMRVWNSGLIFDGRSVALVCFRGGWWLGGFLVNSLFEREVGRGKEREGGGWMFPSLVTMFRLT